MTTNPHTLRYQVVREKPNNQIDVFFESDDCQDCQKPLKLLAKRVGYARLDAVLFENTSGKEVARHVFNELGKKEKKEQPKPKTKSSKNERLIAVVPFDDDEEEYLDDDEEEYLDGDEEKRFDADDLNDIEMRELLDIGEILANARNALKTIQSSLEKRSKLLGEYGDEFDE